MKKNKLLMLTGAIPFVAFPMLSVACKMQPADWEKKKPQLLNSTQIQEIKDSFVFELNEEGRKLQKQGKLNDYWNKLVKDRKLNKSLEIEGLFNWNAEFKKYFKVSYHPLKGFNSAHKYQFRLLMENNVPAIHYQVLCVDLRDLVEVDVIRKLDTL
ncbi:hypothetical protein [Metamycoplasma alkalescens]|uniref:Lipoprotein n=1 Tax=Metamycoplasma alkalescens TaxID=45363 RepID=A0A318U843_9BACT|nr:hypothetical protein [Metamycoplasma alkalescens]PYF43594.1 hypothetical protein BCF88_10318 [Metamycoplasma alkalescens]